MNWFIDLISNPFLITAVSSWLIAQVLKTIIHAFVNKKIDVMRLFGDGGMPSGHSATVTSLAMMSALVYGADSFEFAVTGVLALVVCHDAMGVRLETGKQAMVLNELVRTFEIVTSKDLPDVKLKEFVGHSPFQVAAGVLLGIANALIMYNVMM
ncbi:MAG: divergent PAP2 family protein [Lachnospira sp.]|nr:divergent PAP2 family protein [Lachnospira sp.]